MAKITDTITPSFPRRRIYNNILETVGGTPLVKLNKVVEYYKIDPSTTILLKLEFFNPLSSVKDRVAFNIVYQALQDGRLRPGMELIEATSGNTGIGLCGVGNAYGFKVNIVMPTNESLERKLIIKACGATLIETESSLGMQGSIALVDKMVKEDPQKYFATNQFANPDNTNAHQSTAREIWEDTNGKVDIFVSVIGTTGTLIGVGENLKKKKKDFKVIAVQWDRIPCGGPYLPLCCERSGGFVPSIFKSEVVDDVVMYKIEDALKMARAVCKYDGIMIGNTAGLAVLAALKEATKSENKGKTIVVIIPSSGERDMSTELYNTVDIGSKTEILDELLN
ncbi:cysteine synthase A, putative [Entamoeba invadens IP1]|uniref:Cysteine synthase A, putative n=1 Tax=Entamoeba invadens IP1 TaxID=370355 RepID=L7FJM9_ENTIV|nr:cysteine synthase A, putative [Entamoeba invadens IP1]ELP83562.1 cysteine synthase A, putative [Entamoeba invadens IP1]|eukprot:XP_004182908.1 cysteine synthase A, putative [Entamoeba invadens IP1]